MASEQSSSAVVRSRLRWEDQIDLAWFFVEGSVAFDRSPMGAMLERAELLTFGALLCPKCSGEGYEGDRDAKILGAIEQAKKLEAEMVARGESFSGQLRRWRLDRDGTEKPPWYDDGQCKTCAGAGWIPRRIKAGATRKTPPACTARPTGSSVNKRGGQEPSSDVLERYGLVSRKLSRVDLRHRETLAAYFGLAGLRWAEDRYRGRIWGVLPLTPAGKKLVKQSRKKGDGAVLTDDQVLNVEAELERAKPMKTRGALFAAARSQALELLAEAERAWKGEDGPGSAVKTLARIREALGRLAS